MTPEEIQETRNVIISLLELLSDIDAQIKYQENAPIANVPGELVCQWFDDHKAVEREWFKEAFSNSEQTAIKEFHYFFDSKVDLLPKTDDIHELQQSSEWHLVVRKANETLARVRAENA